MTNIPEKIKRLLDDTFFDSDFDGVSREDHRELKLDGQQKGYVVLAPAERSKGFVRPVRRTYIHKACGSPTTMSSAIAETYARDPGFYSATFCIRCRGHFPVGEFVWIDSNEPVGS